MSCRGCQAIIECDGPGNELDVSQSFGFFATQDYSFVIDCPPGYICFDGNPPIIIPGPSIPPVIYNGGPMCLQGCLSLICVTPLATATQSDLQSLANFLFFEWAHQQAQCNKVRNSPGPGFPPPIKITGGGGGGGGGRNVVNVYNEIQCYTAHCLPNDAGHTDCVDQGTYGTSLYNPTDATVASTLAHFNAVALATAQQQATAGLVCGVCNAFLHVSQDCAGDPGHTQDVTIPANTYCFANGTPQAQADAAAAVAAQNQLHALLVGAGCLCPGPTIDPATGIITNACNCHYRWNLYPSVGSFSIGPGSFDFRSFKCCCLDGNPILPGSLSIVTPLDCPGPPIQFYYTAGNLPPYNHC